MAKIKTALVSVYDKTGIVDFCRQLAKKHIDIISSNGTAKVLREAGLKAKDVSEITGFPEMLDGRVKTLHPRIHAGLLAIRKSKKHSAELKAQRAKPIDLVVVNLYPFEQKLIEGAQHPELIENIDIGGPALIRSAAKNYQDVAIVTSPEQYGLVLKEISKSSSVSDKTRQNLAAAAFNYVAHYDSAIDLYFQKAVRKEKFPQYLNLSYRKKQDLCYGENYDQLAAFYSDLLGKGGLGNAVQLQGKQLSYNNILDMNSAWDMVNEFSEPAVAVIKHTNPCGVAIAENVHEAFKRAYSCDTLSAFGGVVASNREITGELAKQLTSIFLEEIIAPSYSPGALAVLQQKEKVRVVKAEVPFNRFNFPRMNFRDVSAGIVTQTAQVQSPELKNLKVVTKVKPTKEQLKDLLFAWKVCKHVKSNSVVFAKDLQTVGIGAGQMSRVDSTKIAAYKSNGKSVGAVMASDAFFPFRDAVDSAADAGIRAIIQPGGSIRDKEVIQAANERGIAMVFSGIRTFRH